MSEADDRRLGPVARARRHDMNRYRPKSFALIIGAMKSGTTTLFELLGQHPEIAACKRKEPSYFNREDAPDVGWEEYQGLWNWDPDRHKIALEGSTSYAKAGWDTGVPERIRRASAKARFRFIYMMRDPIPRMESQVRHGLHAGWGKSLDEGVEKYVVDFTRYAMQVDQYMEHFPRESMLLLTLEELASDPDEVLRRTCTFLGVSPDRAFVGQHEPRNKGTFYQAPSAMTWLANRDLARSVLDLLPSALRRRLRDAVGRFGRGRHDALPRWQFTDGEKAEILQRLSSDLRRLRDVYDIDVARHWSVESSLPDLEMQE